MEKMENVYVMDHPLIKHKISMIRNKHTGTNEFRKLIEEIAVLMGYEALRDLPIEDVEIETPIETCMSPMISGKKLAIVPVLRAGLGMVNGVTTLVPSAKIGHIGLYRDPETHEPHEYYCKLAGSDRSASYRCRRSDACNRRICCCSCRLSSKSMAEKISNVMFVIAAPEGVKRLHEAHPDVQIYIGHA